MSATTFNKRRVALIAMVAGALTVLAPVAQAAPPDVVERAVAAKERSKIASIDARERGLTERPSAGPSYGPDAIERALATHTNGIDSQTVSMLDRRERALVERPVTASATAASDGGFNWSDFGLGAGVGVGIMLLVGLGTVALRRNERISTA